MKLGKEQGKSGESYIFRVTLRKKMDISVQQNYLKRMIYIAKITAAVFIPKGRQGKERKHEGPQS